MARKTILDLRQQAGHLLIMGFDGLQADAHLRTTLNAIQPGGVILFARNIETPSLMMEKGVIFEGQCKMENIGPGKTAPPAGEPQS